MRDTNAVIYRLTRKTHGFDCMSGETHEFAMNPDGDDAANLIRHLELRLARAEVLLRECRGELEMLPRSIGYEFSTIKKINSFLDEE